MNKKVFAFDLGRVLFDFDIRIALGGLGSRSDLSQEKILEAIYYDNFGVDYEKGLISNVAFYEKFCSKFKLKASYKEFKDAWCGMFSPKEDMIEFVSKIRKNYPVYMISNISDMHFHYLYEKYQYVFNYFLGLVLSFKEKSVKPEEKIYKALKDLCGVPYQDIIYIDDREDLIAEAGTLGFCAIQFKDLSHLLQDLKIRGITLSLNAG